MAIELATNSRINREIAKAIISAQMSSDGGKDIATVNCNKGLKRGPYYMGYALKDTYILRALKMIMSTKNDFSFYVKEEPDQNGYASVLVYFEYNYGGKRQVSFHTPARKAGDLYKFVGKGRKTHWNGAHTSRANCELLAELFKL